MKLLHLTIIGASTLLLAGCGGSGGGGGGGGLSQTNITSKSSIGLDQSGKLSSTDVTVSQDGETITYNTTTLTKVEEGTDPTTGVSAQVYGHESNGKVDAIAITINSVDGGQTILNDTKLGLVITGNDIDNDEIDKVGTFHTGNKTSAASMPSNITASYGGRFIGFERNKTTDQQAVVGGEANLLADFGANTVTGQIDRIETVDGVNRNYDIQMNGTIAGTGYSGTAGLVNSGSSSAFQSGQSGTVDGQFYGNGAAETGGNVNVTGDSVNVGGSYVASEAAGAPIK